MIEALLIGFIGGILGGAVSLGLFAGMVYRYRKRLMGLLMGGGL